MTRPILVFDLDGTLIDSAGDLAAALAVLLEEAGRASVPEAEVRRMVGRGARVLLDLAWRHTGAAASPEEIERLYPRFLEVYRGCATERTCCWPGVVETLRALEAEGHVLAVCTNKPLDLAEPILDALGLAPFFGAVLGGDSLPWRKPDPRHLLGVLEALGQAGPAVLIGDSAADVGAARAAGWPVIVVSYGFAGEPPEGLGADVLIDRFDQVPAALRALEGAG